MTSTCLPLRRRRRIRALRAHRARARPWLPSAPGGGRRRASWSAPARQIRQRKALASPPKKWSRFAARMERSEMRERLIPDYAALHPGYGQALASGGMAAGFAAAPLVFVVQPHPAHHAALVAAPGREIEPVQPADQLLAAAR